jgi:hypothetical protein
MGQLVCLALRFALFLELFVGRETPHLNRQSSYPRTRIEQRLGRFFQPARKTDRVRRFVRLPRIFAASHDFSSCCKTFGEMTSNASTNRRMALPFDRR